MALYLLYESASGYALFLAHGLDEIGQNTEAVRNSVSDLNRFGKVVQLTAFHPFESALESLNQCNAVSEGDLLSKLRLLLFGFCFFDIPVNFFMAFLRFSCSICRGYVSLFVSVVLPIVGKFRFHLSVGYETCGI